MHNKRNVEHWDYLENPENDGGNLSDTFIR